MLIAAASSSSQSAGESILGAVFCIGLVVAGVWWAIVNEKKKNAALGTDVGERVLRKQGVNYLGGYPARTAPASGVILAFSNTKVAVENASSVLFSVPLSTVTAIDIETEEEVRHRLTASRLLLVGVFAFAWKKRTPGSVMVTIETDNGQILFEVPKKTKPQVLSMLAEQRSRVASSPNPKPAVTPAVTPSPAPAASKTAKERLDHLEELRAADLVSDDEYTAKRSAIISDL